MKKGIFQTNSTFNIYPQYYIKSNLYKLLYKISYWKILLIEIQQFAPRRTNTK